MTIELPAPSAAQLPAPGDVIDRKYRLEKQLGQGGMGSVYLARHEGTGRWVALKLIRSSLLMNQEVIRRFEREARTLGKLRHPNVVNITDYGTVPGSGREISYLVMEYLEGSTLRQLLDERAVLPVPTVVDVIEHIASAVAAAHELGIVHRDLKPDNIWLVPNARGGIDVKVLDFGIAKVLEQTVPPPRASGPATMESDSAENAPLSGVTLRQGDLLREQTEDGLLRGSDVTTVRTPSGADGSPSEIPATERGTTIGTPNYMSPEQCRGDVVGPASDIYSLGVIAYECLCGSRPFSGGFLELLEKHQKERPRRLDESGQHVSAPVADCIDRALAKEPSDRYCSAAAFAGTLRVASSTPSVLLRRAAALYAEHFGLFNRLALRAAAPVIPFFLTILAFAIWRFGFDSEGFGFLFGRLGERTPAADQNDLGAEVLLVAVAVLSVGFCYTIATATIRTAIAHAHDRMRRRPLAALDPADVLGRIATRVGMRHYGTAAALRTAAGLARHWAGLAAHKTPYSLSHIVTVMEDGLSYRQSLLRARSLLLASRKSYEFVQAGMLISFVLTILLVSLVYSVSTLFRLPLAEEIALWSFFVLLPLTLPLTEPLSALALVLYYFSARQANGEDIVRESGPGMVDVQERGEASDVA